VTVNHLWNFEAGEKEFRRAAELNPNYAPAYHWHGLMLWYERRYDESFQMMQRAGELDPGSRVLKQTMAVALMGLGRTSEALKQLKVLAPDYPKSVAVRYWMTVAHLALGEFREAVEEAQREVELDGWSDDSKLDLAYAKAVAGEKEDAARLLQEVTSKTGEYVSPVSLALVELGLGNEEAGFEWLKKACEQHDPEFLYFRSVPLFAKYWTDRRLLGMERRAGLVS
jgi:tetratricopeptide (TPR) repeat protein